MIIWHFKMLISIHKTIYLPKRETVMCNNKITNQNIIEVLLENASDFYNISGLQYQISRIWTVNGEKVKQYWYLIMTKLSCNMKDRTWNNRLVRKLLYKFIPSWFYCINYYNTAVKYFLHVVEGSYFCKYTAHTNMSIESLTENVTMSKI